MITPEILRMFSMQAIGRDMKPGGVDWAEYVAARLNEYLAPKL